ncbi:3D-(3,5/4)-trihydroxycyclohexane-1,2-dione acylhydrolase (decyclizing) [Rhodanobacter sp. FDAARGOS 1247]|uniref:3D-(3,5/4)-trihydroxycyclohexane-1,2-dione acylhydrolase (decyclizing) n=1 Tax=Rhodanobacter sp. FDAARGOS 1247 TaxID=2778082 RepID=UPI00194E47D9|nr:3D-(3,5/4)-trihydroxycyclohexane-1,2-dione acylhydrolase (decyclizing) [Rhodanobacter sp. FDAARGOS 1247]QRP62865.1 3D-(3,5/4)-trihydroxycyclohexane-1,2-dione acylhydrolase (decyclizing) [Rhodanobacter sp. FDAARGOS 1247]
MAIVRLTAAQATVRWLAAQYVIVDGEEVPYFAGAWAIFGHGNVAGFGEALHAVRDTFPTWRAHNEQGMAHAAIAYAKQMRRRRAMVCTSSIGPGATNMVTAAALAHVNRLPVLLLPGDVFASHQPDPVLQQVEDFADATVTANDCFRPVSRHFERITRPEQIIDALPKALATMLDPASCGPATIAFCQDVQAEAFDYPETFFARRLWRERRPGADPAGFAALVSALKAARHPLLIAGGGVLYSGAETALAALVEATGLAVAETQAGKGALPWNHSCSLGSIGVTGSSAANAAAARADLVVGIGTRLADFTTGSRSLFEQARKFQINVQPFDAHKHDAQAVLGDARTVLQALSAELAGWRAPAIDAGEVRAWNAAVDAATAGAAAQVLPSDAQVIGAVQRSVDENAIVVCAAGGLPGELHKLWRTVRSDGYHVEYGYSCMGYEIAGGLGVKMAAPGREVVVMVGDGSYLMMNSELASSVMLGRKLIVVLLDNRGYGCINRLQHATGGAGFNNLLADAAHDVLPSIDFAAHAASLGALSEHVATLGELEAALVRARAATRSYVVVIDTDPLKSTEAGGWWWDVAVPEVSERPEVEAARRAYEQGIRQKKDLS